MITPPPGEQRGAGPGVQGHPILQSELARVRAGGAMEPLDLSRCLLDPPAARADVGTWKKALDNAHSQLGHQYNR